MKKVVALVNATLHTDLYADAASASAAILFNKDQYTSAEALLMWAGVHVDADGAAEAIFAKDDEILPFLEARQDQNNFVCDVVIIDRVTCEEYERFRLTMESPL